MNSSSPHSATSPPAITALVEAMISRLDETGRLVCTTGPLAETAVHEARKNLKSIRAGLRMLSDAGGVDLSRANGLCRDVGRLLSGLRDIDVCLLSLEGLPEIPADSRRQLTIRLQARREELHEARALDEAAQGEIAADLRGIESELRALDPVRFSTASLVQAMNRSRELGEKRCRGLEPASDAEKFHDVRKAAKRELYQRRYLAASRQIDDPRIDALDGLGEHLGRHQDLCVLRELAAELGGLTEEVANVLDAETLRERSECLDRVRQVYGIRR